MFALLKPKETRPLGWGLRRKIEMRFDPARFELARDLSRASEAEWLEIFARYPSPPSDMESEDAATDRFFMDTLKRPASAVSPAFVVVRDGKAYLLPRQEILDLFAARERWILRTYYAATGRLLWIEFRKAQAGFKATYPATPIPPVPPRRQVTQEGKLDGSHAAFGAWQREYAHYLNQARQQEEQHRISLAHWNATYEEKRRAHMKEWGPWFLNGLEFAFKTAHSPGPRDLTGQNIRVPGKKSATL